MDIKMPKGFKITTVDMYIMKNMKHIRCTMGFYRTSHGVVVRKNDVPIDIPDVFVSDVYIGGAGLSFNDSDTLYKLPIFTDNLQDSDGSGFTLLVKSDLSKKDVETLFEKL